MGPSRLARLARLARPFAPSLALGLLLACAPAERRSPSTGSAAPAHDTPSPRVRFERAGEGDVAALVRTFAAAARADGRTPLVYVGATWCEPCGYFHAAAERGDLDGELPPLALLEFDLDRDGARLSAAGYSSRMIPLFVVPDDTGRGSDRRIEGSIHGPGSPSEISPRLVAILPPR